MDGTATKCPDLQVPNFSPHIVLSATTLNLLSTPTSRWLPQHPTPLPGQIQRRADIIAEIVVTIGILLPAQAINHGVAHARRYTAMMRENGTKSGYSAEAFGTRSDTTFHLCDP